MSRTCRLILTLSVALMLVGALWADTIAVIPGVGGFQSHQYNGNVTFGWQFTLSSTVTVTGLGYFDAGNDGLFDSHPVGIFDGNGVLLVSATVPSGTSGTLQEGFRFTTAATTVLGPGFYTIGGYANGTSLDDFLFGTSGAATISGLSLGAAVQGNFGPTSLTFPYIAVGSYANQGFFGPTFRVRLAPDQAILNLNGQLATCCRLSDADISALSAKLQAAYASIQRGNTNSAGNQLRAFTNQVRSLKNDGLLSAQNAAWLIAEAESIIASL